MKKRYKMCIYLGPRLPGATCTDCRRTCAAGHGVVQLIKECQTCPDYVVKVKAQYQPRPARSLPGVEVDHFSNLQVGIMRNDDELKPEVVGQGDQHLPNPVPQPVPDGRELERLV